jgi:hypothetical protein
MKSTKTKNSKVYLFAGAVILAVAGYFGYQYWRKKHPKQETPPPPAPPVIPAPDGQNSGGNSNNYVPIASNPFKTSTELMDFQKWVINTKKDTTILGNYGADGKWGSKSASAFAKYGKEYLATSQGGTQVYPDLEKDIKNIITSAQGVKAEASYLRATALKYPKFVQTWSDAIDKLKLFIKSNPNTLSGTTFTFANQIYDVYQGNKISDTLIMGKKAYVKSGTIYAFEQANRYSKNMNISTSNNDKERGVVKGYFYNANQKILFVYIPQPNSSYAWLPISAIEKFK